MFRFFEMIQQKGTSRHDRKDIQYLAKNAGAQIAISAEDECVYNL